jgi:ubiquinone biosynthesis protein COQ9
MIASDRLAARDAAIRAMLPVAGDRGWTMAALRDAASAGSDLLFPGGSGELVEAYIDLADRDMAADAAPSLGPQKISQRVRTLIASRLDRALPYKAAVRRAAGVLARPVNAGLAARCTARTVDAIWLAAGDKSVDFSWYSKRAILAGVYGSTLLFWLDERRDQEEALAFLDRRLAGVARLGRLRRGLEERFTA